MRGSILLTAGLLAASFAGCGKLTRESLALDQATGCPVATIENLLARQSSLGPRSTTAELQCALVALRMGAVRTPAPGILGSRVALSLAERNTDPSARGKLAAEGARFAEQALTAGGDGEAAAHYYLAANLGLAIRDRPTLAAENLPRVEKEARRAVDLNAGLDDGGPLRVLGMLYLKAPPWPAGIGDGDQALDLLKRAAKEYPGHPLNRLFYGQALWEVDGETAVAKARSEFNAGRKLLDSGNWGGARNTWLREFATVGRELGAS